MGNLKENYFCLLYIRQGYTSEFSMYQAIIFSASIVLTALCVFLFWKKSDRAFQLFLKISTFAFCAVGFFRFMLSDSFIYVINDGWHNQQHYQQTDVLQSILRWGYYLNYAILPMAVFCNSRLFKNLASYICLPFTILSVVYFNDFMVYFLDPKGHGLHLTENFRYAYFIIELVMALSIPLILQIRGKHCFNIFDKWEWVRFFVALPCVLIMMVPAYVPQSFIGYPIDIPKSASTFHLIWIAIMFAFIMLLYLVFRFRSYRDRYMLCVFLTIVLFFHYDSLYLQGFTIKRLPVQLCNIAAYFYLIAIPLKLKKMFHFCFIANIVGALIAILMPDFSTGGLGFWNMHYIMEHTLVLAIPILCMGLRIFPRLKTKSLLYFFIGFTAYFLFAFISGTILNGYSDKTLERVNFFYMFDLNFALDKFPFLTFASKIRFEFGRFEVYPLIPLIIYVAFSLLCLIFYKITFVIYKLEDDHLELRNSRIDLFEKITGKKSPSPRYIPEETEAVNAEGENAYVRN